MVGAGFLLAVLAAFDVRFLGEDTVVVAAVAFTLLAAAAAGATITAAVVERRDPSRIPLPHLLRWWFAIFGGALTLLSVWGAWWLVLGSDFGTTAKVAITAGMASAALVGAVITSAATDDQRLEGARTEVAVWFINAGIGLAVGVLFAIAPVVAVGALRTLRDDVTLPVPPPIGDAYDHYVALGDSYSAGEGIPRYFPETRNLDEGGDRCHRSPAAYPLQLVFESPEPTVTFRACSGAVTDDLFNDRTEPRTGGPRSVVVSAQVDPRTVPDPSVELVTLTMGGNDVAFSQIVRHCFELDSCTDAPFDPFDRYDEDPKLHDWAMVEADALADRLRMAYRRLREAYPQARIVVIGYPYLFPGGRAGVRFSDCDTVLRRVSTYERVHLRELQDELTARLYREAIAAGVEFISPAAVWDGHEPCGDRGQYTNALNPIVFDGSFHPNRAGQRALATLVACYLDTTSRPAPGELVRLPWETGVTDAAPAPGTLARPVPCPEAEPDR